MKIGILGSGDVGKALAAGCVKHGHGVMMGTRESGKLADWAGKHNPRVGTFDQAAAFGEMIMLAVKGSAASAALQAANGKGENLRGKPVIDATNPITDAPPVNGVLKFFTTY